MRASFSVGELATFRAANKIGSWVPGLAALARDGPFAPSRQVLVSLAGEVAAEAARVPVRWGHVHDLVALLATLTDGAVFDDYQAMHPLAPSQVNRASLGGLGALYRRLQATITPACGPAVGSRLASFAAVADLFRALVPERQRYEARVRALSRHELSLVLAAPGLIFSKIIRRPEDFVLRRLFSPPDEASPEDVATGASYTLTTFNRLVGIGSDSLSAIHGETPHPEPTFDLLGLATTLFSFAEAEVDVFRAGYACTEPKPGTWVVSPPNETIGRAFELGYIDSAQQEFRHLTTIPPKPRPPLLSEVAREFSRQCQSFFKIFAGPPRRVRLELEKDVAREIGKSLVLGTDLYLDEMHWIASTCYELVARPNELRSVRITPHLTLWDVILVSRIFRLLCIGWLDAIDRLGDDTNAKLNSSIRVGSPASLVELISAFGFSSEVASDYVSMFTWDTSVRDSYADLQYKPFLRIDDQLAIPVGVHEYSNLLRNALLSQQKRLSSGTLPDVVTDSLVVTIRETHSLVASGTKFRFRGEESDIDVAWRLEDTFFAFECKNSVFPCSSFEMRSTLDQLDKAAKQLSRLQRLWAEPEFRVLLQQRLPFSLQGVVRLRTAIVLSHRIYAGAHYKGHPVRHLHAINQFIRRGESAVGAGDRRHIVRMWSGSNLRAFDLERHLDHDSPSYATQWASQEEYVQILSVGGVRLGRMRYPLNIERYAEAMGVPPGFADRVPPLA